MIRDLPIKLLRLVSVHSKKKKKILHGFKNIWQYLSAISLSWVRLCSENIQCWAQGKWGKIFKSETFLWIPSSDSCKYYSGDVVFIWILGRLAKVMTENTGSWIQGAVAAKTTCQTWPCMSEHRPRQSWHNLPMYNILDEKNSRSPRALRPGAVTCLYSKWTSLPWEGDLCAMRSWKSGVEEYLTLGSSKSWL